MLTYYTLTKDGCTKSTKAEGNWLILQQPSPQERQEIIKKYQLPHDIFPIESTPEDVTQLEFLQQTNLKSPMSLVLMSLAGHPHERVEERLHPISFIISDNLLITDVGNNSSLIDQLLSKWGPQLNQSYDVIGYCLISIYDRYIGELTAKKQTINDLEEAAQRTTKNQELFNLATTQRDLVYLEQTLDNQAQTLERLWEETEIETAFTDAGLAYDVQLKQQYADKSIHIYRDLLDTIGGLFSDMMSNNLNHLMKYLDSAALVISVPALVGTLWGMNTGGLPGKQSEIGFWIMMVIAFISALLTAAHLARKKYGA